MSIKKATASFAFVVAAVIMTACGGGDSKSTNPTNAPTNPPTTTAPAPPTTVEETTTTEPAPPDYSYEVVFAGEIVRNQRGEYFEAIPADAYTVLKTAQNPVSTDAATLGDIVDLAPGDALCAHGYVDPTTGTTGDLTIKLLGTGLISYLNSAGEPVEIIAVNYEIHGALLQWTNAVKLGVIPDTNGTDWVEGKFVSLGDCPT